MSLTILEAAKMKQGTILQQAVVELFAETSPLLQNLPFRTISGNSLAYNQEDELPGVAFRGVNGSYTASTGVLNPQTEALRIVGGDIDIDTFIIRTEGSGQRAAHERMKIKKIAETFQTKFIKGDSATDKKEFDGLQVRLVGNQLIDAGATSGGDALSLAKLDELIDNVINDGTMWLIMNKSMARKFSAAARDTTVGGFITYDINQFGQRITSYNGTPIMIFQSADGQDTVLPFTEANPGGGGAASTSIYAVAFGTQLVEGLQNGDIDVRDLGELNDSPKMRTRIEWYVSIMVQHGRAAARLQGIKDSAIVA